MSEPIEEGTVLGGRYRVTGLVTSNDEDDLVLTGVDQVLNRQVSILVPAADHCQQVADSAREIAVGERSSAVQVLDLGLAEGSGGRTYLIANEIDADELLALVHPPAATPYVEPFYTDTLGSEIFGESRQMEPQVYEDDEEYYGTLNAGYDTEGKRPLFAQWADRLSARRQQRNAAAEGLDADADAPLEADAEDTTTAAHDAVVDPVTEETPQPDLVLPPKPQQAPGSAAGGSGAAAAAAAGAASSGTQHTAAAAERAEVGRQAPADSADHYADEDEEYYSDDQPSKAGRLVALVAIALVVVIGVAIALLSLNGMKHTPVAEPDTSSSAPASQEPSPTATEAPKVKPVTKEVTRVVPDQPDLNSDYDNTLPLIIDGNNATSWNSYTFQSANFGGFAKNMALVVKLEKPADISEVKISQSGGSGGAIEVLVSDTPDLAQAKRITTTSFTGPEISISVSEDGKPAKAQYVIINVTELPRLQGGNRPFGMRIAEISVN